MHVAVSEAKGRLTDLVRRAETGEEVILTRHGQPAVRLTPVTPRRDATWRRALLDELSALGVAKARPGPEAARSQDHLYNDEGLPR